jgi:nitrate/TMAO reductase-like tetraheme cytochrome c subunit
MKLRHTWGWIAPLALALLAVASLAFVPATRIAAAGAPITVPFDHLTTGVELDGVHRDLPCESCHLNAVFRGTPRNCGTCHTKGSLFNATPKTATHISSTNNCAACHNTISFRPQMHFSHAEAVGSCVSCHNGTIAQGEGRTHPATSQNCAACHTVISWNPPSTVDHTQIPMAAAGFCIICHNGSSASGKPAAHIATNLECGDCHLTTTWVGATFDHTGITSGCANCHNGTKAVGKQGSHMPTTNLCENCHTSGIGTKTPSWVPSKFDHTQMTVTTCLTCHSGSVKISTGVVSGQPSNHVPVPPASPAIDCSLCHANNPSAETWTVIAASIATLHSGLNTKNCLMCHAGETFAGVPAPYIPMSMSGVSPTKKTPLAPLHIPVLAGTDCSACHGAAYQAGGFGPATPMSDKTHQFVSTTCDTCHDTGRSFYVGGGTPLQLRPANHVSSADPRMATSDCSVCHETKDWLSTALPAGHMPNPSNLPCATCHASAPSDYTPATLAALSVLHTGIAGNCGLCHGNTTAALTWANNYTPKDALLTPSHIPYLSGTDCSSCHAANYITGGFGPTNMSAAKHAFVPTACDTCHEAGLSFYLGASTPALQGRPTDHMSPIGTPQQQTGDCSSCHNTTDWSTNIMPTGHMPNPGNQACATCHTAITGSIASYATMASISILHTGISGNCGLCHGTPAGALTFYNNNDDPKSAVLSPLHIPYLNGTDCSSCHAANYVAGGFGPTNMSPAKHAFVPTTCDTCHDTGKNFYLGASTPVLQVRPQNHISTPNPPQQATGDCSLCHNTTVWTTPTTLPNGHMPIPGTQTCSVCHTGNLNTPAGYATLASIPILHTGITTGCAQCHGGTTQLMFYNNYNNLKAAASLSPAHIPAFTGQDCSSCHKPNYVTGGFGPMNMTQATHAGVGTVCKTCHEAGLNFYMGAASPGLQGRPANHTSVQMAAPNDCASCHTTANWNSGSLPVGHMPNPGNQACAVCHTAAPANYTTLAANSAMHTGITSSQCAQCHGGTTPLTWYNNFTPKDAVLSPSHIPYLAGTSCGSCHSSTSYAAGTFGPMNMTQATHSFVTTNCVTCHERGLSFYMGAANPVLQGRPADHTSGQMVAPNNCGICHTTANWNSTVLPAGHMPNPGNQTCTVCHTAAPANYKTLAANAVLHTGISSGCISCHGAPNAAPPVFYLNFTPKDALLAPVHIPTSSTPCESCHAISFTSFSGTTMTAAKHTTMLSMTGGTCDQCHDLNTLKFYGVTNLTTRPNGHHAGQDCNGCHNPNSWKGAAAKKTVAAATVPTRSTIGTVVTASAALSTQTSAARAGSTRGGADRTGVSLAGAIQAGSALGTANPTVSHAGVTSNCVSCHNGVLAAGKGPAHIASNGMCQNCHTTIAWLPARFDHQGVMARCASCHNGVVALGKPTLHVQTNQDCSTCHGTITWTAVMFSHVGISAACQSCHNGITATGKQVQHVRTTLDCASCHNTLNWTIVSVPARPRPVTPSPRGATSGPTK